MIELTKKVINDSLDVTDKLVKEGKFAKAVTVVTDATGEHHYSVEIHTRPATEEEVKQIKK